MGVVLFRTLILYTLLIIAMRMSGKRQIGQLQPTELVMAILVSDLVAVPMQDTGIPLINGIIPLVALMCMELLLSGASLKSRKLRNKIYGTPSVLIAKGTVCTKSLQKHRISMDDLSEELRLKNVFDISTVDYAVLETNGQLSVMLKPENDQPTRKDMGIKTDYKGIPAAIIMDGSVYGDALKNSGYDMAWLTKKLKQRNLTPEQILLMTVDKDGKTAFCLKNDVDGTNMITK
ncbi:MAG: DUF421 domain-containing protein [Ruminococcaceae bacterium]|nr:DUF421 domain-containing protein [Oscillospiraceae bacterium]